MITETQKTHIMSSLERLNCPPIELVERFYDTLFQVSPETEVMFKGNMNVQYEKLLEMLMLVLHSLENLGKLVVAVEELGANHVQYGVEDAHYTYVGQALLSALSQSVEGWDADDLDAWSTLYGYLSDLMVTGARSEMPKVG